MRFFKKLKDLKTEQFEAFSHSKEINKRTKTLRMLKIFVIIVFISGVLITIPMLIEFLKVHEYEYILNHGNGFALVFSFLLLMALVFIYLHKRGKRVDFISSLIRMTRESVVKDEDNLHRS